MTNEETKVDQTHKLYCPACKKTVLIPYATEISSRSCPECGAGAETLWPSEVMYVRDRDLRAKEDAPKEPEKIIATAEPVKEDDAPPESVLERLEQKFTGRRRK